MGRRCRVKSRHPSLPAGGRGRGLCGSMKLMEQDGTAGVKGFTMTAPPSPIFHGIVWKRHHTAPGYTGGFWDISPKVQPQQNPSVRCEALKWEPGNLGSVWRVNEQKQGHADAACPCRAGSLREEVAAALGSPLRASRDAALTVRTRWSICGVAVSGSKLSDGAWRPGIM